ncbi:MAG: metalloregulator ArsR/SmtB family transcription factor [Gemmatimonadales bacterium]|jgi:ArsR family transcriptional regulator
MNDSSHVKRPAHTGQHDTLDAQPLVHATDVARARATLCREDELTLIADTFQILANPTRIQILRALASGELCVGDLAAVVDASHSAVSHHLRQLRQMRLVRHRRDGKLTYYTLDDAHVAQLFELGLEHVQEQLR